MDTHLYAVLFILHPMLGFWRCFCGGAGVAGLVWSPAHGDPAEACIEGKRSAAYLQSKLRNAEVLEPHGHGAQPAPALGGAMPMRRNCRPGAGDHAPYHGVEQVHPLFAAVAGSGAGALLVIDGQLSPGA